ncbi:hypothetical protein ACFFX0_14090 [Citricoccus parietis]|uniref:Uncharacterized protein n=1 Tax=Citricoccus parietis TaxID=592307 RepID=A0ABV5G002_9MICC
MVLLDRREEGCISRVASGGEPRGSLLASGSGSHGDGSPARHRVRQALLRVSGAARCSHSQKARRPLVHLRQAGAW